MSDERTDLQARMAELSAQLAENKHALLGSGRIPDADFRILSHKRGQMVAEQSRLQSRLTLLKAKARDDHNAAMAIKGTSTTRTEVMAGSIMKLRDSYLSMSRDPRCTEAVRFMANEFQERLSKIVSGNA